MQNKSDNHIDILLNLISSGNIQEAEQYCQQFHKENKKIKSILFQQFYSFEIEGMQQLFIRNIHSRLTFLIDDLFVRGRSEKKYPKSYDFLGFTIRPRGVKVNSKMMLMPSVSMSR